jgi:hypothetical protein
MNSERLAVRVLGDITKQVLNYFPVGSPLIANAGICWFPHKFCILPAIRQVQELFVARRHLHAAHSNVLTFCIWLDVAYAKKSAKRSSFRYPLGLRFCLRLLAWVRGSVLDLSLWYRITLGIL